jgi:hypothetical protein
MMVVGERTLEDVMNAGDVSIFTRAGLKDDRGNEYDEAIEHVAVTPFPALSGLTGWTPIAASRGGEAEQVPVFEFGGPEPVAVRPVPAPSQAMFDLAREAVGVPVRSRCAVTLALASGGDGGHWITLHGVPVHIDGEGTIDKGPASVTGMKASKIGHDGHPDGTDQKKAAAHHERLAPYYEAAGAENKVAEGSKAATKGPPPLPSVAHAAANAPKSKAGKSAVREFLTDPRVIDHLAHHATALLHLFTK